MLNTVDKLHGAHQLKGHRQGREWTRESKRLGQEILRENCSKEPRHELLYLTSLPRAFCPPDRFTYEACQRRF